jgi:Ca2+-binding EF-hand superfamily protein
MQNQSVFSRRPLNLLGATLAGLVLSLSAQAQTMGPGGSTPSAAPSGTTSAKDIAAMDSAFMRADSNNDGSLSPQEASRMPAIAAKFSELDKNSDGVLSKAEFGVGYFDAVK